MTPKSAKDIAFIFFDELDVKQSNNEMTIADEAVIPQRRPFGSAYKNCYPTGQYDGEMTISGWLDSVTEPQLGELTGDDKVVSVLHEGNAVSDRFYGIQSAKVSGRKLGMADDDLDTFEPVVTVAGELNFGYVVGPHAARTTAGNTDATYATMVETSAASGHAFLHVSALALGGSTSCTVKVRHSTDHITFTDHTAFPNVTAVGAQVLALAATVNKYLSFSHAWNGAGSDQSISCFVGVAVD